DQQGQRPTHPGLCDYPDNLYRSGVWMTRAINTDSSSAPCAFALPLQNEYCVDYSDTQHTATITISSATDTKHTFTYSGTEVHNHDGTAGTGDLLQFAFANAGATGVKLTNLHVTHYANTDPVHCDPGFSTDHCVGWIDPPVGGAAIQEGNGSDQDHPWTVDTVT